MFNEYLTFSKEKIRGNMLKSALMYFSVPLSVFLFLFTLICTFILFFYDTSLFASIGVFNNNLYLGGICAFFTFELIFLFYLMFYATIKKHSYFSDLNIKIDFRLLCKFIVVEFICFIKKSICLLLFLCPAIISGVLSYYLIDKGISRNIFIILVTTSFFLGVSGLILNYIYMQKYSLVKYVCLNSKFLSVSEIFKESFYMTDGKMLMIFRFKLSNIIRICLCFLVIPSFYYLPLIQFYKYRFIVDNKKPYEQTTAHTEKSVIFYFKPIKEN